MHRQKEHSIPNRKHRAPGALTSIVTPILKVSCKTPAQSTHAETQSSGPGRTDGSDRTSRMTADCSSETMENRRQLNIAVLKDRLLCLAESTPQGWKWNADISSEEKPGEFSHQYGMNWKMNLKNNNNTILFYKWLLISLENSYDLMLKEIMIQNNVILLKIWLHLYPIQREKVRWK